MEKLILDRLSALAHPKRLEIFRLLMRRYPDRIPAGEIAAVLNLPASSLSAYLAALHQAGLIRQDRAGTSLRYDIAMDAVRESLGFLLNDCCRGRPDLCAPLFMVQPEGARAMPRDKFNVLFICTGNSARSIFAESILRKLGGDRFVVHSAGTQPNTQLNPFAVEVLRAKGHEVDTLRSKHVSEFQGAEAPAFDFVFTVCDQAANEACPPWEGLPLTAHWGMPDPVKATGTDAQKSLAFQHAYGALRNRIAAFVALPISSLDRISLQRAVDDIGRTEAGESA